MTRIIQLTNSSKKGRRRGLHASTTAKPFVPMKPTSKATPRALRAGADHKAIPSAGTGVGNATVRARSRYEDPELAAREAAAKEVVHTVAPLCNKGAYQLITGSDIKTAGRKV